MKINLKKFDISVRDFLILLFSAILLILSFPKTDLWFLAWIGLVPFFILIENLSTSKALKYSLIFGFIFHYGNIFWLNTVRKFIYQGVEYHPTIASIALVTLGIPLMGLCLALFTALFTLSYKYLSKYFPQFKFLLAPSLWVISDYIRTFTELKFPWNFLGYSQYKILPIIQISSITGVYGVTFLIILFNYSLANLFLSHKKENKKIAIRELLLTLILIVSAYLFGISSIAKNDVLSQDLNNPNLRVHIVQPNINQTDKWNPDKYVNNFTTIRTLIFKAQEYPKADLIILPETAVDYFYLAEVKNEVNNWVKQLNIPIVTGTESASIINNREFYYNSIILLNTDLTYQKYDKIHLVPFGEGQPYLWALKNIFYKLYESTKIGFFFELYNLVRSIPSFDKGKNETIFNLKIKNYEDPIEFGSVICFESVLPFLNRKLVKNGAQFIVIVTNDAWYENSRGPYQHFQASIFRAVENNRPVIRCANTGISAIIDPNGKIVDYIPLNKQGIINSLINLTNNNKTFYTKFGDVFSQLLLFTMLILSLQIYIKKRKGKNIIQ